ncbi:MAG: HIT domain-containing protein [Ilumatobacteraceae bacterium]|jgi:ATP adenylyltransferase|nr:HIT domain-containing protein [Ilumatobacteraceae bacterium]
MLERLWAGWRAEYVSGFGPEGNNAPGNGESIFSGILASGLPDTETHIVQRGPTCFVILNAYPYASGHCLVLPYRQVANLEDLTDVERDELWCTVRDATLALKSAYAPAGLNVGLNLGAAAGGSVAQHLHVHLVPRWVGDTNFTATIANTKVLSEALASTATRLRAAWPQGK